MFRRPARIALLAVMLVASGCSNAAAPPSAGGLTITGVWVRPPMGADRPAAGYLTITNSGRAADALVAVRTSIAKMVEIHETSADASGVMAMHPVERLDVAPGATVSLKPGGYHLMLLGVETMPAVGGTVELTLTFETAGDMVVTAQVRTG